MFGASPTTLGTHQGQDGIVLGFFLVSSVFAINVLFFGILWQARVQPTTTLKETKVGKGASQV